MRYPFSKSLQSVVIRSDLVKKINGQFIPLFSKEDVNRNNFFHLRMQLIDLGCPNEIVIEIAKEISMKVLGTNDINFYDNYILHSTYIDCKAKIETGIEGDPESDPESKEYSHTALFSAIYEFEISLLKSLSIKDRIADIGCADGLFVKLASNFNLKVSGYDIKKPTVCHDVTIFEFSTITGISPNYKCVILNHVLEHIDLRPDIYLKYLIDHFGNGLEMILISLPTHKCLRSHLASFHQWVVSDPYMDLNTKNIFEKNGLYAFSPKLYFDQLAKTIGFRLEVIEKLGIYVFSRR